MIDLDELRSCTRCSLSATRQRVVVGSGPHHPRLMVVGEAPGRYEDEGGEPFIGRSGQLLFALLGEEVGVERDECFVTNVVKCRPPGNRTPARGEILACHDWFDAQVKDYAPAVVLALGNVAARALFDFREGVGVTHGRIVTVATTGTDAASGAVTRGLATYHPAAALRGGSSVVDVMRGDLRILRRLLEDA
ncbi:MAG: uracil-DNA glycosylase [Acidimicrobiales bacterium]